ncbi:uncharacterized protein METZ01_LOCUS428957, partial [marine metagenome]
LVRISQSRMASSRQNPLQELAEYFGESKRTL